ncbi:MAG: trigger factor [Gemmatimonadota bacterium]
MTDNVLAPPAMAVRCDVEALARWRRRLALHVPAAAADKVRAHATREIARRAKVRGFRPGRAPLELIAKQYAGEIDERVTKELVFAGYEAGMQQAGLEPIAPPAIEAIAWTADGALEFTAEVDVRPQIALSRTTGFRIDRPDAGISDADVDRVLEGLRRDRGTWQNVERPAVAGDQVVFDSVPLDGEDAPLTDQRIENHTVVLGESSLLPDFERGLAGTAAGETTRITAAFPDDHPNQALRGSTRTFQVAVHGVQERELPPLDDAFAAQLGAFTDLAAVRGQIRTNLEAETAAQAERGINEALIDEIIAANAFELPESMVERYLNTLLADRDGPLGNVPPEREAELRQLLRPGAERAMRRYLIVQQVAAQEGLAATDAELDAALGERIDPARTSVAAVRGRLQASGELDDLRLHLTMERVFAWLRDRSEMISLPAGTPAAGADKE